MYAPSAIYTELGLHSFGDGSRYLRDDGTWQPGGPAGPYCPSALLTELGARMTGTAYLAGDGAWRKFDGTLVSRAGPSAALHQLRMPGDPALFLTDDAQWTAPPATGPVWDPAHMTQPNGVVLSNGGLTAASNIQDAFGSVRATVARSAGKYVLAFRLDTGAGNANIIAGALQSDIDFATDPTATMNSHGAGVDDLGEFFFDGAGTVNLAGVWPLANGDHLILAIDFDAHKVWAGSASNGFDGDPAAGTGNFLAIPANTELYPGVSLWKGYPDPADIATITAIFTAADFPIAIPAGFSAWDGTS